MNKTELTTLTPFGWTRERYTAVLETLMRGDLADAFDGGDPDTFVFELDHSENSDTWCGATWWSFSVVDSETVELFFNETSPGGGFCVLAGELKSDSSFCFDEESWNSDL
jgi:hypothetical protein